MINRRQTENPTSAGPASTAGPAGTSTWNGNSATQPTIPSAGPESTAGPAGTSTWNGNSATQPTISSVGPASTAGPAGTSTWNGNSATEPTIPSVGPTPAAKPPGTLPSNAVAGIAIGCLIAGAIIALIACFFLYRRQNRKRPAAYQQSHLPYDRETKSGARNIESFLPQPVEDAAITKEVSKIRDNIKNHVQTYYHFQPVSGGVADSELAALATATSINATVIAAMLANPSMRVDTMRLFIAWAVLSRCEDGRQPTLLPSELVPMLEAIPRHDGRDSAKSALFSQWKVLTGALLEQQHGANPPNCASIIDGMDLVLGPFVQAGADDGKRRRNLEMILTRTAKLAFLLFSQPGTFRFDFAGSQRDSVVVFPGLVQVAGDEGQVLSPPRVLIDGEFASG